jgi:hypothetical protein
MTTDNHIGELNSEPAVAVPMFEQLPAGCPPGEANNGEKVFFAAHRDAPPSDFDFTTAFYRNAYRADSECSRKSNSVMAEEGDIRHLVELVPKRFKYASRGMINPSHGVWMHTPENEYASHHSLWLCIGIRMHEIFNEQIL